MGTEEHLVKLQSMSIQEKLALLSDTDKAYLSGYIDRAAIDIKPHLRTPNSSKLYKRSGTKHEKH
jgi:hypothetical protein